MAKYQNRLVERAIRRLRPSPERVAGAAAIYDPELMIQLKSTRRREIDRPETEPLDSDPPGSSSTGPLT